MIINRFVEFYLR